MSPEDKIEQLFARCEMMIIKDIVRRIKQEGKITSTADYQLGQLLHMGYSTLQIERMLQKELGATLPEVWELCDKAVEEAYVRYKPLYEHINEDFVPYAENEQMQAVSRMMVEKAKKEVGTLNVSGTLGFTLEIDGKRIFTPLHDILTSYTNQAIADISTGAVDYNTVLRRVVKELTNSGLRTIDYVSDSGRVTTARADVYARRAVMTGLRQVTMDLSEQNAEKAGTDKYEVDWHSAARPSHAIWQGRVLTKRQLVTVCGLGSVDGLCGANCYHFYYPFVEGLDTRKYDDKWLKEQYRRELEPVDYHGKKYTAYERKQEQRRQERYMRAQREAIVAYKAGDYDKSKLDDERLKYRNMLSDYKEFCGAFSVPTELERVYLDGLGRVV